jgi:hypothetical protein
MSPLGLKGTTWSWEFFGTMTFLACVVYSGGPAGFPPSQLLEQILPGFRWLTPGSILLGVAETFVYGAYAGFVFTLIHNTVLRRSQ